MAPQRLGERREVRLHDIADDLRVDSEVLVDEDVAESSDLRPRDTRVSIDDLRRKVVHGFADGLQVAFDRIPCHPHQVSVGIVTENGDVSLTSLDRLEYISDALGRTATHNATASASADVEIGRLSSWTGKMSISSRPNSSRVSSMSPEARMSSFPSAGFISTRMSMSEPAYAVPRAMDPKSFGFVAPYRSRSRSVERRVA